MYLFVPKQINKWKIPLAEWAPESKGNNRSSEEATIVIKGEMTKA